MGVPGHSLFVSATEASQIIANQLAEVGITVTTEVVPGSTWAEYQRTEETAPDAIYQGFGISENSPVKMLTFLHSEGIYTWGPQPVELDQAIEAMGAATTEEDQVKYINEVTDVLYDEALLVYLWPRPQINALADGYAWPGRGDQLVMASEMTRD